MLLLLPAISSIMLLLLPTSSGSFTVRRASHWLRISSITTISTTTTSSHHLQVHTLTNNNNTISNCKSSSSNSANNWLLLRSSSHKIAPSLSTRSRGKLPLRSCSPRLASHIIKSSNTKQLIAIDHLKNSSGPVLLVDSSFSSSRPHNLSNSLCSHSIILSIPLKLALVMCTRSIN